ncbi:bifunctional glycosyltransferase family 2/GtrA family protein [Arthrobacter sp. UM1]|nr:bifunctional glycosyltransferase family 2/GtrA family protein [Arthrobacter sp. UM1]MCB4207762.1 bifunctional glycosyltransferase family 2/GtrA family protein [Arthrobacter sp. UM1]
MENTLSKPILEIVIPVYNEEHTIEHAVRRLNAYLDEWVPYSAIITVADNASTDSTLDVAERLSRELERVDVLHLDQKGRGRALKQAWTESRAEVAVYMDVDLSTDLRALLPLVAPLISGHSDLAIGTRLSRHSKVVRGPKREFISRSYNAILKSTLAVSFSDAQCGFKAIRTDVARTLLPMVEDNNWFFDTEMLVIGSRAGLRIHEVPVDWVDDPDSRVDIAATAMEDLRGIARLAKGFSKGSIRLEDLSYAVAHRTAHEREAMPEVRSGLLGQILRFGIIGAASTLAYMVLYWALRMGMSAQVANFLALLITAVLNTAANRRFTFGVKGGQGALKHHLGGLAAFGLGLALTSGSLFLLKALHAEAHKGLELFVLVVANLVATLIRFLTLRLLMNRDSRHVDEHVAHPDEDSEDRRLGASLDREEAGQAR